MLLCRRRRARAAACARAPMGSGGPCARLSGPWRRGDTGEKRGEATWPPASGHGRLRAVAEPIWARQVAGVRWRAQENE